MMMLSSKIDLAVKIAFSFLGRPYVWGGDDPMRGFDCSGFVIEVLKSVGMLPREGDWTAAQLFDRFNVMTDPLIGGLVFYRGYESGKIIHVELLIDEEHSIGASGGGSKTMTGQDAIDQNAYIKVRPWKSRGNVAGFCDPFERYH